MTRLPNQSKHNGTLCGKSLRAILEDIDSPSDFTKFKDPFLSRPALPLIAACNTKLP